VVLFWNELRADRVAVVFRPKQFLAQSFTVLQARHKLLVTSEANDSEESAPLHSTVVNISEMLASMVESNQGVIESFDLK